MAVLVLTNITLFKKRESPLGIGNQLPLSYMDNARIYFNSAKQCGQFLVLARINTYASPPKGELIGFLHMGQRESTLSKIYDSINKPKPM